MDPDQQVAAAEAQAPEAQVAAAEAQVNEAQVAADEAQANKTQAILAAQAQALLEAQAQLQQVLPSLVSVEWTWTDPGNAGTQVNISAGSVLHKSDNYTYILTFLPENDEGSIQVVHFHDQVETNAKILLRNEDLRFAVLRTGNHESSVPIQFNDEPMGISIALCVAPKTNSLFQKVDGFIPRPSCQAHNMAGNVQQNTEHYFLFVCQQRNTEIIKSAPVFHQNNRVNGFIIQDCSFPPDPKDSGSDSDSDDDDDEEEEEKDDPNWDKEAKICIKPILIARWLQEGSGNNNWKPALDNL